MKPEFSASRTRVDLLAGQARDAVERELADGDREAQVDDLAAAVADLDAERGDAAPPMSSEGGGLEPKPPGGSSRGGPCGHRRAAPGLGARRARRGSGRPPRRSGGPRRRGAGPARADRRSSAPPPERPRAGLLEDLEPAGRGLDVEVAALERAEDRRGGPPRGGRPVGRGASRASVSSSAHRPRDSDAGRGRGRRASQPVGARPDDRATGGGPGATGGAGATGGGRRDRGRPGATGDRARRLRRARPARSRMSPDVVRTDSPTTRRPTTSVRRPRPPSAVRVPFARTSPAIVWVSMRTGLARRRARRRRSRS